MALLERGTISHVGSHTELLATVPEYRYLLAADDEIDDTEHDETWLSDDERDALDEGVLVGMPTERSADRRREDNCEGSR